MLDVFLSKYENEINQMAATDIYKNPTKENHEEIFRLLGEYQEADDSIMFASYGTADAKMISYPDDGTLDETYNPTERPWYIAAEGTDSVVIIDPYLDSGINAQVVTASKAVYNDKNEMVGVISMKLSA